jgi:hypothetical protein
LLQLPSFFVPPCAAVCFLPSAFRLLPSAFSPTNSVLIVDDEEGFGTSKGSWKMKVCQSRLRRREGVSLRLNDVSSCVLLDVAPGIDGIETLERLRTAYPDTAVIMIRTWRHRNRSAGTRLGLDFINRFKLTAPWLPSATRYVNVSSKLTIGLREALANNAMIGESVPISASATDCSGRAD